MSTLLRVASAAALAAALAAPSFALADWTAPTTISSADEANPIAQGAYGGSVLTGWLQPAAALSVRLGPPTAITAPDPNERVWSGGLDRDGNAIVLTVRKHKPLQRIRAILVAADGTRSATRSISDRTHSAAQPTLAVAPDGTAVAAWGWHDPAGWRAQVAIRRPGQPRFEAPQTVSPPAPTVGRSHLRPFIRVAAGDGGRGVVSWQVQTGSEAPLHVVSAGADSVFGADQALAGSGRFADVALAVGAAGAVQVAYLGQRTGPTSLRAAAGTAGTPLSPPVVLATGGKGTSSGPQVAAAFAADGTATVAWAKPGNRYEDGGPLEVFTRAPGAAFGPAQTLADAAQGVVLAGGPGVSTALAWMRYAAGENSIRWAVHAALRPPAGGPFGAETTISDPSRNALWPTIAMTPASEAIAAWVTNTSGGGSGRPAVAIGSFE